jgi:hypothetical protein
MPSPYEDWTRGRERATSQPPRPGSGGYDSAQGGGSVRGTNSPGQGLHTQLPLGTHLDMKQYVSGGADTSELDTGDKEDITEEGAKAEAVRAVTKEELQT